MIVVDASVWVDLLRGLLAEPARDVLREHECVAPPHVDFEVGNALLRAASREEGSSTDAARRAIELFSRTPLRRVWATGDGAAAVAHLHNVTYADGWYLALAARLDCSLMTKDRGMIEAGRIAGIDMIDARDDGPVAAE